MLDMLAAVDVLISYHFSEINPYVIVACEKAKYRSKVSYDLRDPEWNFATIFYRKHPLDYNVSVQVRFLTFYWAASNA